MNKEFNYQYVNLEENNISKYQTSRSKAETIIQEMKDKTIEKVEKIKLHTDQSVSIVFNIQGEMHVEEESFIRDVIVYEIKYNGTDALLEVEVI